MAQRLLSYVPRRIDKRLDRISECLQAILWNGGLIAMNDLNNRRAQFVLVGMLCLLPVVVAAEGAKKGSDQQAAPTAVSQEQRFESDAAKSQAQLIGELRALRVSQKEMAYENNSLHSMLEGDFAAAKKNYDAALSQPEYKDSPTLFGGRGQARLLSKDYKGAYDDFSRTIELIKRDQAEFSAASSGDSENKKMADSLKIELAKAIYSRAMALGGLKDYSGSLKDLDAALAVHAEAQTQKARCRVLIELKRYPEAASAYDSAIKENPLVKKPLDAKLICSVLKSQGQSVSACD
jgi:tetratricopeptide (TPR) repeat protein